MEIEFRQLVKDALELDNVDWGVNEECVTFPAAMIYMATEDISRVFDGPIVLRKSLVRVDVWAEDITECITLKNKLRIIDGFTGDDESAIHAIHLNNLKQSKHTGDNFVVHQYSADFTVWHY